MLSSSALRPKTFFAYARHLHALFLDGVYREKGDEVDFHVEFEMKFNQETDTQKKAA